MNIKLLRSLGAMGYNIKIERDGSVFVKDRQGNELVRGTDYIIENPDIKRKYQFSNLMEQSYISLKIRLLTSFYKTSFSGLGSRYQVGNLFQCHNPLSQSCLHGRCFLSGQRGLLNKCQCLAFYLHFWHMVFSRANKFSKLLGYRWKR